MISNYNELREVLSYEKRQYFNSCFSYLRAFLLRDGKYYIWRYQKSLRVLEYLGTKQKGFMYAIFSRRVNVLGRGIGIELWEGCFEKGLHIYHPNGIVVNSNAKVGKNCILHGNNCIGNDGYSEISPIIGDDCELGVGAVVIGNIKIANNVRLAAGAVVIHSIEENFVLVAGIPGKIVKKLSDK